METKTEKHSQHPLIISEEYHEKVQMIIDRLYETPRDFWIKKRIENPESIGEFTDACVGLAEQLFPSDHGLALMIKVSNWHKVSEDFNSHRPDGTEKQWTEIEKKTSR